MRGHDWAVEVGEVQGCAIAWVVLWSGLTRAEANELVADYQKRGGRFQYRVALLR